MLLVEPLLARKQHRPRPLQKALRTRRSSWAQGGGGAGGRLKSCSTKGEGMQHERNEPVEVCCWLAAGLHKGDVAEELYASQLCALVKEYRQVVTDCLPADIPDPRVHSRGQRQYAITTHTCIVTVIVVGLCKLIATSIAACVQGLQGLPLLL